MRALLIAIAIALAACATEDPCAELAPPALGLDLDSAREAHRRAALRQELRYRDALAPGYTLRAVASFARPGACTLDRYEAGRLVFEHAFDRADGLGAPLRRVQDGERGGPDTTSCTSCHWRGGRGGGGGLPDAAYLLGDGDRASSADARNPPSLVGVGAVQALAAEMTAELHALRDRAIARARRTGETIDVALTTKSVSYGTLHVSPKRIDTRDVGGVDADLVVRPFGWKGTAATLDEFVVESAALHFGVTKLQAPQRTALAFYVASLAVPIATPDDAFPAGALARGRAVFGQLGCATCHVPRLVLHSPLVALRDAALDLSRDAEPPRIAYDAAAGGYPVELYSDLKRHDLGEANASKHRQHGIATRLYLTRRLWGLGDSSPYFYDGASPSIDHAIDRHGGEALFARDAWASASAEDRTALRVFLASLRRAPRFEVP